MPRQHQGKSGRSAQRLDQDIEGAFVRNQNMIAQNLLTAEETRGFREMALQDRVQSQRNRAYSQVAIAPTKPLDLIAPRQLSGPSTMGRNLAILNAGIGMAQGISDALPPSVGDPTGGGSDVPGGGLGGSSGGWTLPESSSPLTGGINYFG